jgi:hypothetical protein
MMSFLLGMRRSSVRFRQAGPPTVVRGNDGGRRTRTLGPRRICVSARSAGTRPAGRCGTPAGSSRTSRTRPRAAAETGVDRRPVSAPQRRRGRRGECDASARWPSPPARDHARRGHDPAACAACTSGSRASSCGANEPSCCSRSSLPPGWARWLRMRRAHGSQCRTIRLRFFGGVRCSPR